ncbi:MAG: RHS repeat-associated core domain-containing protein [Flavobacteriaceae bacterium]|jgi:RHS repeat-associated protein|nr:RHS repeat-associated core domain-containing protein [Flavobacteriaceae bacterium]
MNEKLDYKYLTDEPHALAGWGYEGTGVIEETDLYFYHPDHLGSTSYVTTRLGKVSQHVEYIPFGEILLEEHNGKDVMSYKFNAKELDEETSLYYYGARYFDSKVSVWISVDPLAEMHPHISSYAYCANNPIKYIDPDGRDWVEGVNGDITWRDDVTKDNYQTEGVLKEGEIYRGTTYAREKEWNNNRYKGTVVEIYRPDGSGLDYFMPNENGMYRFPESGKGFERYMKSDGTSNGNNENYTINGTKHTGDNYASATTFANFYNTIQDFYNETGVTIHYGDISAYDPSINLGHSTHFTGNSIDIHYFGAKGEELQGINAYSNADIKLTNSFFRHAQNNGFTKNYSFGGRFTHKGNNNQKVHKDHLHIGR